MPVTIDFSQNNSVIMKSWQYVHLLELCNAEAQRAGLSKEQENRYAQIYRKKSKEFMDGNMLRSFYELLKTLPSKS